MPHPQTRTVHIGRAGWFGVGALAASTVFVLLIVAGEYFRAGGSEPSANTEQPAVIIEGD
ncbi:hypothetical protein [Mesorhizobium sp. KR9-304]|uniref:hypothetical protein n=1 Tax=Mesorhizobium sp. KR9-304 TaxID=3156614 RepID=UPI0032B4618B